MRIPLIVGLTALCMLIIEWRRPGRLWQPVPGWWVRAATLNAAQIGVAILGALTWDRILATSRPWSIDGLNPFLGAIIGYIGLTFIYYWWHRARHASPLLWRLFHQVHHSPSRIEIITSFYKHPLEIIANGLISSSALYVVMGLDLRSAAFAVMLTGWAELFYHWNIKTPHWLGYIIQRPESHCWHHRLGSHRDNYADLPIWDMLFGTFHNPSQVSFKCGFEQDGELALKAMLRGREINAGGAP